MDSSPGSIWSIISSGGVPALLFIIIYGGFKKDPWWVFGWVFRDLENSFNALRQEKNEWKELALSSTSLAKALTDIRREGNRVD